MKRTLAVYQNNPKEHETLNKMNELDFHDTLQIQIPDVLLLIAQGKYSRLVNNSNYIVGL
jgi:hypothetical protein